MQPLPNHVVMMQIDCEVINTALVHIKEDAIPIHLTSRMRSETGGPATPTPSTATNFSSLQRNNSKKSHERFRDYEKEISAAPQKIVPSHGPVIRLRGENDESTIQTSYNEAEPFEKDDFKLIKRKFRHFSATNLDRFSKLAPSRLRRVNHS